MKDYSSALNKIKDIVELENPGLIVDKVVDFLYNNFDKYSWIGIYVVQGNDLILGPWRGKQATEHTKIPVGNGICGAAASSGKTEIISDVAEDERYLSCFISTKSEIVVPIFSNGKVIGEIDIDSDLTNAFDHEDSVFLEKIAEMISSFIK